LKEFCLSLVSGTRLQASERNYYRLERLYGRFARQLRLPSTVAREEIRAEFDAGILIITLPKRER
jgi:HSP20 family protein